MCPQRKAICFPLVVYCSTSTRPAARANLRQSRRFLPDLSALFCGILHILGEGGVFLPENRHLRFLLRLLYAALALAGLWLCIRFLLPWLLPFLLAWGLAALLLPVGLLLILHLSGLMVARTLERPADGETPAGAQNAGQAAATPLPPHVERFYSIIRHAPTVVILLSLLVFGGLLLFVDGLVDTLGHLGGALLIYLPWIVGGLVIFLTVCYVTRQFFLYRHHQMEREYAFRQTVLERTGIILLPDGKTPLGIPPAALNALPAADPASQPAAPIAEIPSDVPPARPGDTADDIVDADISPVTPPADNHTPA